MKKIEKKLCITSFLFLSLIFFVSCPNRAGGMQIEPVYKSNIVWTLDVNYYDPCGWSVIDGDFLYQVEGKQFEKEGERPYFYLSKVNLDKGEYVWKSEVIDGVKCYAEITECGGRIFAYDDDTSRDIYCFSAETGERLATLYISQSKEEYNAKSIGAGTIMVPYKDRYLFWPNRKASNTRQIVRLDTQKIDFTKPADEPQYVEAENFGGTEMTNDSIFSKMIIEGDTLYFQTQGDDYEGRHPDIGAIDCETGSMKWIYEATNSYYRSGIYTLYMIDGRLYSFVNGLICFDAETGEKIFERIQGDDSIGKEVIIGYANYTEGIAYWDDKFYYTTSAHSGTSGMTGIPEEFVKNIQCISAKDGSFIWGDLPKPSASMSSRPVVLNGKAFFTTYYTGLRVYDAKTGRLIGVDKNIMSGGNERNVGYKDMLITVSHNSKWDEAKLIAIKP